MSSAWVIVAVILLVTVSMTQADRDDHHCTSWGRRYRHGQLFSKPGGLRCLRYICWYGRVILREEGCEVSGQCHRVGSTFEYNCARYRCDKVRLGSHSILYKPETVSTQCRDFRGRCYRPGEYFSFFIGNVFFPRCTCTATIKRLHYTCQSREVPRLPRGRFQYLVGRANSISSSSSSSSSSNGSDNVDEASEDVSPVVPGQKEEK